MDQLVYSSRSRIEAFLDCPRLGYIRYLWDGRGITKRAASVYLSTGTYTHIGLEHIFRCVQRKDVIDEYEVDQAVTIAINAYNGEIKVRGFDLEEGEDKANEQYIISEQCAMVEAFIRSFAIRVLPDILNRFKIIDVEREEQVVSGNLVMQGRIDVIMEERATRDWYIDSFKTAANWDRRQEKANEHDNQGLSETWILEERLKVDNEVIKTLAYTPPFLNSLDSKIQIATKKYQEYLSKFLKNEKIMGVIMIYMLKGKRYETQKGSGRWEQHCPLIRAYRKLVGTEYEYASSIWYDKPENKSGKGRLGKGWEPFTVWDCEEVGGVKGWIDKLANNLVGGEDVIGNSFKIPAPYFRNQEHIDSWVRQSRTIEQENLVKINSMETLISTQSTIDLKQGLDYYFPQRRKGCHYPVDCEMLDICYNSEVFQDPIGSGKFQYRKPHHKLEMEAHEKLYQVSKTTNIERGSSEEIDILDQEVIIDE